MIEEEMSQEALEEEMKQFFQNISGIQKEVTVSCSIEYIVLHIQKRSRNF